MKIYLYYIYFAIGFVMSFPTIAIQFTIMDITTPVSASIAYGCMMIPWCLKPTFGYISDRYSIFNWGKRKPYIFFCSLLSSFLYINVYDYKDNFELFVTLLTLISTCVCFIDVCADSITVSYAKEEMENGLIQSNTWISRGTGTLMGFVLGGLLYKSTDAQNVLTFCCYIPLITCFVVWNITEYIYNAPSLQDLYTNLIQQNHFILILFFFHISPNYRVFYEYFLRKTLNYDSDDFTYLGISSSMSFLCGLVAFKLYFRKLHLKQLLWNAVLLSSVLRLSQIGVVLGWFPYFQIVLLDGIVESFCGQLIMMPLAVVAAKLCNDGLEGSFFSFIMSIMNFGVFVGDETGALIAYFLSVTKVDFENLYILMLIGIVMDILIAFMVLNKMSFYFEKYVSVSLDQTEEPLDPQDPEEGHVHQVSEKTVYTGDSQD